jgi:hypothetical protein
VLDSEIDKAVMRVRRKQLYTHLVANVNTLLTPHYSPINRRPQDPRKNARGSIARDYGIVAFADVPLHHGGRDDLSHLSLNLAGGLFLKVGVLGNSVKLVCCVWRRRAVDHCLNKPLHDDVGKPAIWSSRMGLIIYLQPKVPARVFARPLDDILTRTHQLYDRQRKIGKMFGVGLTSLI